MSLVRTVVICAGAAGILSGCGTSTPRPSAELSLNTPVAATETLTNGPTSGPEAFSPTHYGVAASPRVSTGPRLKRGGGYEKIGKSYKVKGRRYYPTAKQPRSQTGKASWYGKAFHGRLTANGEVYDMNHLTAAHKTMPLPSYARVTNLKNGHSLIVRVNDRGPFSNNRIIDLSKRAAHELDFIRAGTAQVKVEYLGRAPLHGEDDAYLAASIRTKGSRNAIAGIGLPQLPKVGDLFSFPKPLNRPAISLRPSVSAYADHRVKRAFHWPPFDNSVSPLWKTTDSGES